MTDQNELPAAGERKPQFTLQRIYTKDVSFEAPGSPQSFTVDWKPEVKVQFNTSGHLIADNTYEVILQITVAAHNGGKVVYMVEVKQAGLFQIDAPESALELLLGAQCPAILYPYARELVTDLTNRGTFPPMLLQPMNFDAIYLESQRRRQQRAAAPAAPQH